MSRKLRELTEAQIKKAQAEGKLSNLEGEGKPLPHRPEDALTDAGTAIGHRIMAEHGALPEEFKLKRELDAARAAWSAAEDAEEKKRLMAEIARLELAYNIAVEARRKFLR
ncbi:DnaJ family domain-containing protein [Marimonas lutisalis]|uniref:DnaJ family domain-containing protein n=1 Tax=Marimonas lutisalis TaxID=2545756 RepID=UPI0010F5E797|nr:DUF1992 domain-containing protein [Marimonas lutisalis]